MSSLKKLQEKIGTSSAITFSKYFNIYNILIFLGRLEIDQAINKNDENEEAINDKRSNETEIRILKLEEQLEKMRQMVNENENENNRIARANSNKRLINLENDENERLIINKKTQDLEKKQINRTDSKHRIVEQTENVILGINL